MIFSDLILYFLHVSALARVFGIIDYWHLGRRIGTQHRATQLSTRSFLFYVSSDGIGFTLGFGNVVYDT